MDKKLLDWLTSTGLDEQRSGIYLTCLSMGPCKASQIASELGIGRTAIYDNLLYLERRGYVSKYLEGRKYVFEAISPKMLKAKFSGIVKELDRVLPDFIKLQSSLASGQSVQIFRGANSARHVFEDIIQVSPAEYCYLSNPVETYRMLSRKYFEDWIKRRVKKKIKSRGLRTTQLKNKDDEIFSAEEIYLRKIRYLPSKINLTSTIYIYGKHVGIVSSIREEKSVIIRSSDLSSTLLQLFEVLWSISIRGQ